MCSQRENNDIDRLLDEFMMTSITCIKNMEKNGELKRIEENLKENIIKSDIEGRKKRRVVLNDIGDDLTANNSQLKIIANELSGMNINGVADELRMVSRKIMTNERKVYVFSDYSKKEITNELVLDHPECLLNANLIDTDSRNSYNEIEIDFRFKYLDEMVKYINNEYDIGELNGVEFDEFCRELMEMRVPFRMDLLNRLYTGFNEYGIGWKNRCVIVNGNQYKLMMDYMIMDTLGHNEEYDRVECLIDDKYEFIIQSLSIYLQHKPLFGELRSRIDRKLLNSFLAEYHLDMNNEDIRPFFCPIYSPFLKESVINEEQYDSYLREWLGSDYKWRLLYRASEHQYTSKSFHECCDDKGPTLVIIKSSGGWIFGGYTTQSWSGYCIYYDMK